jgi:hypothetical protein
LALLATAIYMAVWVVAGLLWVRLCRVAPGACATVHAFWLARLAAWGFGALVGATELVARYRDKPTAPLRTVPGWVYIGVNGAASGILLWLLQTGQLKVGGIEGMSPGLSQILEAGFGGMALFRTSVFKLRVKDTDVAIGPAAVLQIILDASDRACDRLRAGPRAQRVKEIMTGVCYGQAKTALPAHCRTLMQNLSLQEQNEISNAIIGLDTVAMSDEIKSYNLGLILMNYVGEDVLGKAVAALGVEIKGPGPDKPPIFAQASGLSFADMPVLVALCAALDPLDRWPEVAKMRDGWLTVDASLSKDADKNVVVLGHLRRYFGPETLSRALAQLAMGKTDYKKVTGQLSLSDFAATPPPPT